VSQCVARLSQPLLDARYEPGSGAGTAEVDRQIAELFDRSTSELRLAWRQLHRTDPPQGLSRDLLIRALAHQLQERAAGGANRALRRRLQTLAGEFAEKSRSFDPALVPNESSAHCKCAAGLADAGSQFCTNAA
jgi:hypothetical protein